MKHSAIIVATALVALAGCKADELHIDLSTGDILSVMQGGNETVQFEAVFSTYGELDDESRAQISAIEAILYKYIEIIDFELEITDSGYEVTIEGEMPMTADLATDDAYFIAVEPSSVIEGSHLIQIRNGDDFADMEREMQGISFMLAPDAFHPTRFRLRGDDAFEVIAPAVQIDGRYHLLWRGPAEDRLSMTFTDGAFDEVGAGFLVRP